MRILFYYKKPTPLLTQKWFGLTNGKQIALFCHGESNARGVAILFKRGFQYQVDKMYMDVNGRFIIMDIKIDEKLITLVNLYAPNNDNPDFFVNIFTKLSEFSCEDLIIGGDFNFVIDIYNDCTNPNRINNSVAKDTVAAFMDEMLLQDVYRHNHPDKRSYTYTQHHPYTASCIDMFLVNYGLTVGIKSDIKIALNTDHSLIEINLQIDGLKRGKGLWKFNTAHLKDPKFLDFLNEKIDNKVADFHFMSSKRHWEEVKNMIEKQSRKWSLEKAKQNKQNYDKLLEMLNKLKSIKDQTTCALEVEHISSKMESVADRLNKFHQ